MLPFQAVVADVFYGEHRGFREVLEWDGAPYVPVLGPTFTSKHRLGKPSSVEEVA